ncbi:tRNA 4-thiouridine(8) synthase ThiI [Candidatus Uhrbacteria bacterium]|nr:tRNA 4-thiouridine(8) synthase ThiI [Candidatus Uhrbacteria bacterium]
MNFVVVHYHEIALKGKNRAWFEDALAQNIRIQLGGLAASVRRLEGRILVELIRDFDERARAALRHVCGIVSFSLVQRVRPTLDAIVDGATELMRFHRLEYGSARGARFAVRTKRSDKRFSLTSEAVNRDVGRAILDRMPGKVDLTDPEVVIEIEIISDSAFVSIEKFPGPGGLPVGTAGRVVALLSGGIDSPVAAWKVIKRGCEPTFLHFHSYPHTSRASITKTRELAMVIGAYAPRSTLYLIPFAEAQRQVVMHAEPKYRVLLYRRLMMRIAGEVARRERAEALVTGESVGQVASQTLQNLRAIEAAADFPVLRPLVGDDKEEIITKAKEIGTYDISIRPHDDCCSLFMPRNPATRATAAALEVEEAKLAVGELVNDAVKKTEREEITSTSHTLHATP